MRTFTLLVRAGLTATPPCSRMMAVICTIPGVSSHLARAQVCSRDTNAAHWVHLDAAALTSMGALVASSFPSHSPCCTCVKVVQHGRMWRGSIRPCASWQRLQTGQIPRDTSIQAGSCLVHHGMQLLETDASAEEAHQSWHWPLQADQQCCSFSK